MCWVSYTIAEVSTRNDDIYVLYIIEAAVILRKKCKYNVYEMAEGHPRTLYRLKDCGSTDHFLESICKYLLALAVLYAC